MIFPFLVSPYNHNHASHKKKYDDAAVGRDDDDEEDDIQILEDYCTVRDQIISYSIIRIEFIRVQRFDIQ